MKTFLAGTSNVDSGKCAPKTMAGDKVIEYFFGKDELKPKAAAKINAFIENAQVGDWQEFKDLGYFGETTLTLAAVRSYQPGTAS